MLKSKSIAVIIFFTGLFLIVINHLSVKSYTHASIDNFLPPAGQFIPGRKSFSFAVMGDSALRNNPFEMVLQDIRKQNVSFILHVGDMARTVSTPHFEWLVDEIYQEIGELPFYAVPGNHDIVSGKNEEHPIRFYQRAFGQPYYWFSYGDVLFFGLNSSEGHLSLKQEQWLKSTLKRLRSSFKYCIFFMHVPPIDPRINKNYAMSHDVEFLKNIVLKNNVDAIFAGHIHQYLRSSFAGIPLYIVPPSGQKMRGDTKQHGYVQVFIDDQKGITVTEKKVTDSKQREYFEFYFSTEVQRIYLFEVGIVLILCGFYFLLKR